jgi:hypothetical protein
MQELGHRDEDDYDTGATMVVPPPAAPATPDAAPTAPSEPDPAAPRKQ